MIHYGFHGHRDFKHGDPKPVRDRFMRDGRMLPAGVAYRASWIDPSHARCYQIMEANDLADLHVWIHSWDDLIDFQVIPVLSSQEYWATVVAQ
jgi:hypothetical protein